MRGRSVTAPLRNGMLQWALVQLNRRIYAYCSSLCFVVLLMGLAGALAQAQKTSGYKVSHRIPFGGEGGWDYLTFDSEAHRHYIARATRVMVVDVESGKYDGCDF